MTADRTSPLARTMGSEGIAMDATVASVLDASGAPVAAASSGALPNTSHSRGSTARGTVLPTFADNALVHPERVRYELKKVLGEGGMGEVALATDHDIGRLVAVKHLHVRTSKEESSVARFVDEIRTVGSLEHPNIVPIHDVGVEPDGRYFFVMKHVQGETLETIIEKLNAGDPAAHATYSFTRRAEIMVALLRALQYAHAQGTVHRDIKPANVMIGKYGEVVVMDWGVAKAKKSIDRPRPSSDATEITSDDSRLRLFTTRHGSLVGTPAYMSPEQARGENAEVDERSDLYSAMVLFHELLTLHHYLSDKTTLPEMIRAVIHDEPEILSFSVNRHAYQGFPPAELLHICRRGLKKDPAQRFQSATEIIDRLEETLDGYITVQCPFTLTKRITREMGRFIDRFPLVAVATLFAALALVVFSAVVTVRSLL